MEQSAAPPSGLVALQVVAFAAASCLASELLLWWFIYRKPEFRAMKANLDKAAAKAEEAGGGGGRGAKRLQKWREEAAKHVAQNNLKTGVIMAILLISSFKLLGMLFGKAGPVARLPFEPPALIRKVTHRGLTDPDLRDVGALLGWGPSRAMQELTPAGMKGWGADKKDS
eukprot:scaffold18.g2009.t1